MKRAALLLFAVALLLPAGGTSAQRSSEDVGLPASVVNLSRAVATHEWLAVDAAGQPLQAVRWRAIKDTGNCCENHLATLPTGRLVDFGGTWLNYSDDEGRTWRQVRPIEPFAGGEGTVTMAPNGDIIGIAWDVYSGDRIVAFKMEAATGAWTYMPNRLHMPFYDREWVSVVPGPHTIGAVTVPYITVLRGGWPSKDVWSYSLDGLTYSLMSNKAATGVAEVVSRWLPETEAPMADWIQPISESGVTPLPGGGALARRVDTLDSLPGVAGEWWIMDPGTLRWSRFTLGDGSNIPRGRMQMDSTGAFHHVNVAGGTVTYRMSSDGGRSWQTQEVALPADHTVEDWDMRANGALGLGVVAVHAHRGGADQDLVLKFRTDCGAPEHTRTMLVGKGDLNVSAGLGANLRFDFATTSILPDGRVATSFMDSGHTTPAVAVELPPAEAQPEPEPCSS
ncbi:MAG: hypothetical protein M3245_01840 [Actinomycetota bacterium]|nr:hypothetical protein [Actinomycetota bacterium]